MSTINEEYRNNIYITMTFFFLIFSGVTHKKTIIEYCENKIKKAAINEEMADRASYILLYELMIMLIQQNGVNIFLFEKQFRKKICQCSNRR